jgi:hypothetical protein
MQQHESAKNYTKQVQIIKIMANSRELSKEDAVGILSSRLPIGSAGKYAVKVTNCGDFHRENAQGGNVIAIANFNAMTPYQMGEAKASLTAGEYNDAVNNNLSLSIRESDYRPSKGEIVDIEVGIIQTKGGEDALMVTSLTPRQAKQVSTKCDFSEFLADAEEVEEGAEAAAETAEDLS